ncbi:MAG: PKD domain-containing protein [Bacteroidales bacterium]|nr:PKD domain-containing protein [Bacteroidales bacterium]
MKKLLIFISLLFFTINLFAQTDREFWFAAPEVTWRHDNGRFYPEWGTTYAGGEPILLRVVTNTLPANVTIEQPANSVNFPTINLSIAANSTQTVNLTDLGMQAEVENTYDNANGIMDKGIHIFSDNLITVYYEVRTRNNCDIFALKGQNGLGSDFYVPFQDIGRNQRDSWATDKAYSAINIVAIEDNTIITVLPSQAVLRDMGANMVHPAGVPFDVVLNKGQTYSLPPAWDAAWNWFGREKNQHIGGTYLHVHDDKKIAVTISDDSVREDLASVDWGCYDLIGDQMVHLGVLGKEYIAMRGQLNTDLENIFMVATENNTRIWVEGNDTLNPPDAIIDAGEQFMYTFVVASPDFLHMISNKKLSVLHVSGFGCEMGGAVLPPTDKCTGSTQVGFTRSTDEGFYLNIMVWNGAEDGFYIDGVLQDGSAGTLFDDTDFLPVTGTADWLVYRSLNLNTATIPLNAQTLITNNKDVFHLGIINGGTNSGCRFGYFSDFNELAVSAEATGSQSSSIRACSYEQIQLYAAGGTNFNWWPAEYLNDPSIAEPIADPPAGSTTLFEVEVSGACGLTDTANVTVKKFPNLDAQFSVDKGNGCSPLEIEMNETSTQIYERYWDFNYSGIGGILDRDTVLFTDNTNYDTDTTFTHFFINTTNEADPDSIENYEIRLLVKNTNDCVDTAYGSIIVYPEVTADFTLTDLNDTIGCSPLLVGYVDNSNNEDFYYWKFGDGVSSTVQNPIHEFINILNSDTVYNTELIVRSIHFCRDTLNMDITLHPYLEAGFTIDVYEGCSPLDVTVTTNNVFEDSVVLVYGDGDTLKAPTLGSVVHTYSNTGTSVDTNAIELHVFNDEGCEKIWYDTVIVFPEFTADYNIDVPSYSGCNSQLFNFTNATTTSLHAASEFLWSFGDGSNSNVENPPPHLYDNTSSADKVYNFTLHAESQYGCFDDTTDQIIIYRAYADFTVDADEGCSPLDVTISNISEGNQITTWAWDFDDATNSALQDPPVKTYTNTSGATQVRNMQLTVTGTAGCSTSKITPITVYSSVDLTFIPLNQTGCDSFEIDFNSTINPIIAGTTYQWDFGDGTSSGIDDPTHIYRNLTNANAVVYPVNIAVQTPDGCTDAETTNITVRPYVNAKFTVDKVADCSPLTLDAVATEYIGIPVGNYAWTYGDGYNPTVSDPPAHTYPANPPGANDIYTLRLDVSDPSGICTDFITQTITVYDEALADFDPKNSTDCNPYVLTFDNVSLNAAINKWDFDDGGTTSSDFEPTYTFTNDAVVTKTYDVELEVTSDEGCTDVTTSPVNVYPLVIADFDIDISEGCSPVIVTISNNSSGGNYRWFWTDDDLTAAADFTTNTSPDSFTHTYTNSSGITDINNLTVIADNGNGCFDTLQRAVTVHTTIDAQFTVNPVSEEGCNPLTVDFTNTTFNGDTYNWSFGDGSSTTITSPTNEFINTTTSDKTFNVRMDAESVNGCTDFAETVITVYSKVISGFSIETSEGCPPFYTSIDNTSVGNAANTYQWLIDNVPVGGSPVDLSDFDHTYENTVTFTRDYEVKLIATNPHGCTSEHTDIVTVYEYIEASYSMDIDNGCSPLDIEFTDLSSVPASTKYIWGFGDGASSGLSDPTHTFYNSSRTADLTYTVDLTVQSPNYCADDTSMEVDVYHQPLSKFFIDNTSSCPPLLSTLIKQSEGEDMFEWRFDDGNPNNTTDANLTYSWPNTDVDVIQTYNLELWVGTFNNCKDSVSLDLNVFPLVDADFTIDNNEGCSPLEDVNFTNESTSPATQFFWSFGDGSTTNMENPAHDFANIGITDRTYDVFFRASSEYNCWDTITKQVTVYVQPNAEFYVDPVLLTFPDNIVGVDNKTNSGPFDYLWKFGDIDNTESDAEEPGSFEYEHWGEKIIELTAISQTNIDCNDYYADTITIIPPEVNADFTSNINEGCLADGLEVQFTAAGSAYSEDYSYSWEFGDGKTGTGQYINHIYEEAGIYYVKMTASSTEGMGEDYEYKTIQVYSNPTANFEVSPALVMLNIDLEARVEFFNLSECSDTSGCSYVWDFGDGSTGISRDVTHQYTELGIYDIGLTVTSFNNCVDSLFKPGAVEVIGAGQISFPNAFTPNGDGLNDVFRPVSEGVIKYELLVYTRWGELIFTTKDLSAGWDGKIQGEYAKPEVYVWKAEGKFTNGRAFELAGDITLIK